MSSKIVAAYTNQELAYINQLIELYGTPYPDDIGGAGLWKQGYTGPDLVHYTYVETPDTNFYGGILMDPHIVNTFQLDVQMLPNDWKCCRTTCIAPCIPISIP